MTDDLRDELARTIRQHPEAEPDALADALLASRVIATIKAEAWDEGFSAGHQHTRMRGY